MALCTRLDSLDGRLSTSTRTSAVLTATNLRVTLTPKNLSTWAIWTDQLGPYVCVEPTFGGNRFLEPESPDEQLAPDQTKTYSLRIEW